jgi:integrase
MQVAAAGEQLALKLDDIDLETGRVIISKAVSQTKAHGLIVKTTKSGKSRKLTISADTLDILREQVKMIEREKALFGAEYQDNGLLFPREDGSYFSPDRVTNRISQFMRDAHVEGSLHKLRHFCASMHISNGTPIPVVSKRLGHANSDITLKIYTHVQPADDEAAAALWGKVTSGMIARTRKPPAKPSFGPVLVTKCNNKPA